MAKRHSSSIFRFLACSISIVFLSGSSDCRVKSSMHSSIQNFCTTFMLCPEYDKIPSGRVDECITKVTEEIAPSRECAKAIGEITSCVKERSCVFIEDCLDTHVDSLNQFCTENDPSSSEDPGYSDCCSPTDPCDYANDGVCDCPGEAWDSSDCSGDSDPGYSDCCSPTDPCNFANDGYCDCPGESWDSNDCR